VKAPRQLGFIRSFVAAARIPPTYRVWIALLLAVTGLAVRFGEAAAAPGMDFWRPWVLDKLLEQHWQGNMYSRAGREDIYQLTVLPILQSGQPASLQYAVVRITSYFDSGGLGYNGVDVVHSPFLLSVIRPFASGSYDYGHHSYLIFSLLCFAGGIFLLARLLSASVPIALALTSVAMLAFKAEFIELEVLNVNNIQLFLVSVFLWLERRRQSWSDVTSGIVLALALALKPNVLLVLPVLGVVWGAEWRWAKIRRFALGVVIGISIAIAAGALFVPAAKWTSWMKILPALASYERHAITGNIALASILSNFSGIEVSRPLLALGTLLITAVAVRPLWTLVRLNEQQHFARTLLAVNAGVLLMLVSARLVWMHYVVLALPAFLYFARTNIHRYGAIGGVGALVIFLMPCLSTHWLRAKLGPSISAIVAWDFGLVILFAWVLVELWNSGAGAATPNDRVPATRHVRRNRRSAST
jgi:hypothetical protein